MNLRPGILDDLGLIPAIEWLTDDFKERFGIPVTRILSVDNTHFESYLSIAIFRVLQESLTNVARHAKATNVTVRLTRERGNYILEVIDNGVGMKEADSKTSHSFGLLGMRERVRSLGGTVHITGTPGNGTTVKASFPIMKGDAR
jgi:two-component system sensor histidine kinase UhpB